MPFILNAWYVFAWPHEIDDDVLLSRTICGRPMVFFRDADGTVAALEDRCCHREMPLSKGWLENGTVRCGYHGLRFAGDGKCVEIPGQKNIPPRARVGAYPTVEKYGWLWVWPGDSEAADPNLIPEFYSPNVDPAWSVSGGTTYVNCHYQLLSDNLLDATHLTWVHRTSLGSDTVPDFPLKVTSGEDWVTVQRLIPDHDPAPFWKDAIMAEKGAGDDVRCDRWQVQHFRPPSCLALEVGVAPAGTGGLEGDRSHGVEGRNLNALTPETEDSTWYFWTLTRNFSRGAEHDDAFAKRIADIFMEDKEVVEAVHAVMQRNPGRSVLNINADAGNVQARKIVSQLLSAEATPASKAAE